MNAPTLEAPLLSLTYVSSATKLFTTSDLIAILDVSRRNNQAADITGLLLYKQGNFMQVLEGPGQAVREAHSRIARDPRHTGLLTLLERRISQRSFSGWSMGFQDLSAAGLQVLPGYSEFLNTSLVSPEFVSSPSHAQRLLLTFREKM